MVQAQNKAYKILHIVSSSFYFKLKWEKNIRANERTLTGVLACPLLNLLSNKFIFSEED